MRALVAAWRKMVSEARTLLAEGDARAVQCAQKHEWTDSDLAALEQLLTEAESGFVNEEDAVFIPPNDALSLVQTILEDAYMAAGMVDEPAGQGLTAELPAITDRSLKPEAKANAAQALFSSPFDEPNPLYITEGARAIAWRRIHGRHAFSRTPKPFTLANRARLVLVGDWGTGIRRADGIADLMRKALKAAPDRQRHAIHLGDIYFSGWPGECQKRFLDHWPVKPGEDLAHSWCLNANHDMYCGGHGYFDVVLGDSRFAAQGGCSHFLLENDHWQILGLDSAYEEWTFSNGQVGWAEDQRDRAPGKQGMLLSHHQPFSDYEPGGKPARLAEAAAPLLRDRRTTAWLWGHEHRGAAYKPHDFTFADGSKGRLPFGACLGHGGVPARPTKKAGPNTLHVLTETIRHGIEKFGMFGFAIVDLDGASATITFMDEKGRAAFSHKIA